MGGYLCTGPQFGSRVGETPSPPHCGQLRVKGNTPDFMLEHFIAFFIDTLVAPIKWELDSIVKAIQHRVVTC